jgi:hypothetical protein
MADKGISTAYRQVPVMMTVFAGVGADVREPI